MAHIGELKHFLSGGAGNSATTASTGGVISSTEILSQSATAPTLITGVTINNAAGNDLGDGTLSYTSSTKSLTWQPFNGSTGTAVDVTAGGTFSVQGGSNGGLLFITVVAASLPGSNVSQTVTITALANKQWDDVTKLQSNDGLTEYRWFYLKNTSATDDKKDVKIWISKTASGADTGDRGRLGAQRPFLRLRAGHGGLHPRPLRARLHAGARLLS